LSAKNQFAARSPHPQPSGDSDQRVGGRLIAVGEDRERFPAAVRVVVSRAGIVVAVQSQ